MRSIALARPASALTLLIPAAALSQILEVIVTAPEGRAVRHHRRMRRSPRFPGDALRERGITSVTQLSEAGARLHGSGESAQFRLVHAPRGVGFFNKAIRARRRRRDRVPRRSVAALLLDDVAGRLRCRAGGGAEGRPQGTLFGQKTRLGGAGGGRQLYRCETPPTRRSSAWTPLTAFNRAQLGGFISGLINDQLAARFARYERMMPGRKALPDRAIDFGRIRKVCRGRGTRLASARTVRLAPCLPASPTTARYSSRASSSPRSLPFHHSPFQVCSPSPPSDAAGGRLDSGATGYWRAFSVRRQRHDSFFRPHCRERV